MIIFQRHDTEYINGLKKDQEFFLTLRSEHVFDGIGEACEETLMLLKTEIEGKIKEYEQNEPGTDELHPPNLGDTKPFL